VKYAISAVLFLMLSITVLSQESSELSTPPNGDNERAEVSQVDRASQDFDRVP